jgi:hypothetical protein
LGISSGVVEYLINLRSAGYLAPGGAVIEIGAQQLGRTFLAYPERLAHLGQLFGIDQPLALPQLDPSAQLVEGASQILDAEAPFARDFWRWLGFKYAAVDVDGSPGSIPLDLNFDSVPPEAKGKYQLVTNFGTTEHVANQLNAFKIIHDLTALNGIMIHELPTQGMLNHGLVNYNFKFFWMLSRSNGYRFIHADFLPGDNYASLPDNIIKFLNENCLMPGQRSYDYKVSDAGIVVVMQKKYDNDFVPPLDVASDTATDNKTLKERYWTVFEPKALQRLQYAYAPLPDTSPPPSSESARPAQIERIGMVKKLIRALKRVLQNSDAAVVGISNQSELLNRKLSTLIEITHELREIHKEQLDMQRNAAEAIRRSTMRVPESAPKPPSAVG